ncbi:MAG: hypothetical protein HN352_17055 [Bacteroidetes bacterium]|jgi:uroporphyrinogen-III decarboxylase|nr:hypothetical protein [Bacteroidota bacterium]MBT4412068.1 hypothetical protein [Bacteroidota bacterium]MBT7463540.1 hypothetical protein [Bacteroidota bacterium]
MKDKTMTSMERVLTTLGHKEPDRVPLFLLLTMHGAKELGLTIKEYFSRPEYVVEGQLRMRKKYSNDCYYGLFYTPIEVEAFGAEVLYVDDGPPNSSTPFIHDKSQVFNMVSPKVKETKALHKVLEAIRMLKEKARDEVPIIGVAVSPFSLPVMQMGFEMYLEVLVNHPDVFQHLMRINQEFCIEWSNAQLEAGATAICYFDPVSSPSMITRQHYLETGIRSENEIKLKELSEYMGVPFEILPVGLDYIRQKINALIFQWRTKCEKRQTRIDIGRANEKLAEYTMVFHQIESLMGITEEKLFFEKVFALFESLFAPVNILFVPAGCSPENGIWFKENDQTELLTEGKYFVAPIMFGNENYGQIRIYRVKFPDYLDRYRQMVDVLTGIIGLAVSNAIKFTVKGGRIEIICFAESENEEFRSFCVKDNGIGVTQDKSTNLFKKVHKSETSGTEREPGTGLGLMLINELIRYHGGEITVKSELGKGSCFSFSLPRVIV